MRSFRRKTFNPNKYQDRYTKDQEENKYDPSTDNSYKDRMVSKGDGAIVINKKILNSYIKNFRENHDRKLADLVGKEKKDFDKIVYYVKNLYGTAYYSHLYETIEKHFHDLKEIKPGTVGGYLAGCLLPYNDSPHASCNVLAAGAAPNNKITSKCETMVLSGEHVNGEFKFTLLKRPKESKEMAYIHVPYTSRNKFPGFSERNVQDLKSLGIKKVHVMGYDVNEANVPITIFKEPMEPENLMTSALTTPNTSNDNTAIIIIVAIIIILLIAYIGWTVSKNNRNTGI